MTSNDLNSSATQEQERLVKVILQHRDRSVTNAAARELIGSSFPGSLALLFETFALSDEQVRDGLLSELKNAETDERWSKRVWHVVASGTTSAVEGASEYLRWSHWQPVSDTPGMAVPLSVCDDNRHHGVVDGVTLCGLPATAMRATFDPLSGFACSTCGFNYLSRLARRITTDEATVLTAFLAHSPTGSLHLEQPSLVFRSCRCGCGSIGFLPSDPGALREKFTVAPLTATVFDAAGAEVGGILIWVSGTTIRDVEIHSWSEPFPFPSFDQLHIHQPDGRHSAEPTSTQESDSI